MAAANKTVQTELLAITLVSAGTQQLSSVLTLTNTIQALIIIDFALVATTAITTGTEFRIEVSEKTSGSDTWRPLTAFVTGTTAAITATVQATQNSGSTSITSTGANSVAQDDIVFLKNGTLANSEWVKVTSITSTTVFVLQDATTNAQGGSAIYNKSQHFVATIDCLSIVRLRVTVNNKYQAGTMSDIVARIAAITTDTFS